MYQTFLTSVWSSITSMIDMLKDSSIGNFMFGNGVTLWAVLITFFCALILLRFFLNPIGGGGIFSWGKGKGD